MLESLHSDGHVASETDDSAITAVPLGGASFQSQSHTAAVIEKSGGTKWAPSADEVKNVNEWNPTGHQGRTASYVQHIKSMFSTPTTTKYYQDQLDSRSLHLGAKTFQFTISPYLPTTWDKMTDHHCVKWLIWYNKMPISFLTGAVASFLTPPPPRPRIPPAQGFPSLLR